METDVYKLGYDIVDILQNYYKLPADLYEINFDGDLIDLIFDINDYAIHLNLQSSALKYYIAEDIVEYILELYRNIQNSILIIKSSLN